MRRGDARQPLVGDREIANLFSMPHEVSCAAHAHSVHANVQLGEESTQPRRPRFSTDLTSRAWTRRERQRHGRPSVEAARPLRRARQRRTRAGRDRWARTATTDGVATRCAPAAAASRRAVHIGDDRPPAQHQWHRAASHTAGARHISNQECAASHGGQVFIDDRLSQPHAPDWRRIDQRVPARPSDQREELRTGGTERGANPIATQEVNTALKATHRAATGDSRECNAKPMVASPLNLR